MKQINVVAFQFKPLDSMKIHLLFHVSLLQPYHASTILRWVLEPPSPMEINGEQKYEMEKIFNFKLSNQQLQYLIRWKGYDINNCIWEPIKHLSNAMEEVKKFH